MPEYESGAAGKCLASVIFLTMATPTPETDLHESTPPFTFEQAVEKHKQEDSTMGNIRIKCIVPFCIIHFSLQ